MPKEEKDYKTNDNLIIGRNAVIELLKSGREVENVLISKGEREGSINRIVAMCKENKIVVKIFKIYGKLWENKNHVTNMV